MARIRTPLSERLGLRVPVVAAPMFLLSTVESVVAAARAGILGAVPSLNWRTPEGFREAVERIRAETDGPFAVNVPLKLADPDRVRADVATCLELRVPVIITSLGDPTEIVRQAHARGLLVFHDAIHLRHARKADEAGVDAVVAVACGAGGHAGTTTPFVLVPYFREHLRCPVIAAGGVAGGRQLAAALALGAELVYMGTRFIASTEAAAPEAYKRMCVDGAPEDVVYTDAVTGVHANFLRATLPRDPGEARRRWKDIWSAGQGIALAHDIKPIAEIVADIEREYAGAVAGLLAVEEG